MATKCYDDPFPNWFEGKINFTLYEGLPVPENGLNRPIPYSNSTKQYQQEATETLLQEFETVLGDVEACHQLQPCMSSTLTPPQSPPEKTVNNDCNTFFPVDTLQDTFSFVPAQEETYSLMPVVKPPNPVQQMSAQWNVQNIPAEPIFISCSNDFEVVDEYVRSCANDTCPLSPSTSSNASCISTDDSSDAHTTLENNQYSDPSKNRCKVYVRSSTEDRKVRKKEQNKNAATRYRQKKKQEVTEIIGEEQELTAHNEKLKNNMADLQREISYLKSLMRDLFKAKGLIK